MQADLDSEDAAEFDLCLHGSFDLRFLGITHNRWSSFRQRDKLHLFGYGRESPFSPILFCLLDPLLRTRNEIPPDMTWTIERLAAEEHQATRRRFTFQNNLRSRLKHKQSTSFEDAAV